jgi:hypothetical protein
MYKMHAETLVLFSLALFALYFLYKEYYSKATDTTTMMLTTTTMTPTTTAILPPLSTMNPASSNTTANMPIVPSNSVSAPAMSVTPSSTLMGSPAMTY